MAVSILCNQVMRIRLPLIKTERFSSVKITEVLEYYNNGQKGWARSLIVGSDVRSKG